MVSKDGELVAFDVVARVFYCEEDGQELAVESTVLSLGISELPREETVFASRRRPCPMHPP